MASYYTILKLASYCSSSRRFVPIYKFLTDEDKANDEILIQSRTRALMTPVSQSLIMLECKE